MIRTRLTLWNSVVIAAVLTFLGGVVFFSTRTSIYGAVDEDLTHRASFLAATWKDLGDKVPQMPKLPLESELGVSPTEARRIEFEFRTIPPRIVRLGGAKETTPWDAPAMARSLKGSREFFDSEIEGRRVRILSLPVRVDGKITGAAQFAANLENADETVSRLGRVLLILLPLSLAITSLIGIWLTRRALHPVGEIATAASQIEARNLSERLRIEGRDEFASLSSVFNSMLDRLQASFGSLEEAYESQRRFIADASHELKTPLTAIKTRLGVARRKTETPERYAEHLEAIERSTNTMSTIVSDLLLLARADEGELLGSSRIIPLESLIEEAVSVVSDAYGRVIECEVEKGLNFRGDEAGLSRAIVNLLDNAARYTPSGGTVSITAKRTDHTIQIQVRDTGMGIPAQDLPHVFDRFYRVAAARDRGTGGTGLGLSIVQSVIRAHGGEVRIESSLGQGTTVTIELH